MFFTLTILFTGLSVVLFSYYRYRKLVKIKTHFAGPESQFLWGTTSKFVGKSIPDIFDIITEMHKTHGEDVAIIAAFNELMLDLSSRKNVEKVLQSRTTKKSFVYDFLQPWLGSGLLISTGEKWFQRRKIITPTFHFQMLECFLDVFNREADLLVSKLKSKVGKDDFDIYEHITLYALDSICETAMGVQINAQDDPNNEYVMAVKQMSTFILRRVFSFLRSFPKLFFLYPYAGEQKKVIKKLHSFTNEVIDSRRKILERENSKSKIAFDLHEKDLYSKRKVTFLDLLLSVTVDDKPLSREDIREEVDTFMFEGHDTTTSGISFTIWHLAKYETVQEKLYEDICNHLGENKSTFKLTNIQIQKMTYLDMVIKESLRLIPPVPIIGRTLLEDMELNGVIVPAGTNVNIKIYNIHRNPKVWPDPEKFDPERFSKANESSYGPYDYIPFSFGSRNCIGQKYATMELKVAIIKLVSSFRILPGESMDRMRFKTDLVIRPNKGIPIKLEARNEAELLPETINRMLLVLALIFAGIGYVLFNYHRNRQRVLNIRSHMDGPKANYFLGTMPMFVGKTIPEIFEVMTELHKVHGEDIAIIAAFNELVLHLSGSKNVEKVLLAKSIRKSFAYDFLEPWLGTGLLISTGEKWFQRRKIITPTFHFKMLESFLEVFNTEADILVTKLENQAGKDEFDIYDYITLYALDSICATSMGVQIHAQENPHNEYAIAVKQMSTFIIRRIFSFLRSFPSLFFLYPYAKDQKQAILKLHNFTNSVIDSRRKLLELEKTNSKVAFDLQEEDMYSKKKLTFLDLLLNVTVDGKPLSREDIREEVDTFMFEGHDTTTSGISFAIWHLAKYQDVQQQLYEEIIRIVGKDKTSGQLSNRQIQELEYLDMVVKESLRLMPPVPIIGRKLVEDMEMNGTIIPAGTTISIMIYNIHRNPRIWSDPDKFIPERFSKSNESTRGPYDYIPFSAGSRNCIGQKYAMMELKVTLIKLLANYRVLPGKSMAKMEVKTDLVLRPDTGIPIRLEQR
ncbi:uncharacterized protein LOC128740702 [Sabethes cyaneus]|uniref:uncharacterized protein LOC128740702 n=1 Tax=Sabethes cyaneus TaxID=53552 RepID=UPI00237E40A2|nr:uncharacterized protein LOC128740702 [Sabethes cyaneus]